MGRWKKLVMRWWQRAAGHPTAAEPTDGHDPSETGKRNSGLKLAYFEDVLPVELNELNRRRDARNKAWDNNRPPIKRRWPRERPRRSMPRESEDGWSADREATERARSPDPSKLFDPGTGDILPPSGEIGKSGKRSPNGSVIPSAPVPHKMRPQPVPNTATGLSLSGGGIRSAAVGLGALQAMNANQRLASIDYLSTVSGGGYIGACLSVGILNFGRFPFGSDVSDDNAVSYLRNYSNYLLPRGRSGLRNLSEVSAILLRGMVANLLVVATLVAAAALITAIAIPTPHAQGSLLLRLIDKLVEAAGIVLDSQRSLPSLTAGIFVMVLVFWAIARSLAPSLLRSGDTRGLLLLVARTLLMALVVITFIELQGPLVRSLAIKLTAPKSADPVTEWVPRLTALLSAFAALVSACSTALGHFLQTSERSTGRKTIVSRILAKLLILVAAAILPLLVWGAYLYLSAFLIGGRPLSPWPASIWLHVPYQDQIPFPSAAFGLTAAAWLVGTIIALLFSPNGYSLHRFYRDRLAKAFIGTWKHAAEAKRRRSAPRHYSCPADIEETKLSDLQEGLGPYHILNAALNVQGSKDANRRGRNADFFTFTPDFIGSDLTFFAPLSAVERPENFAETAIMERIDPTLDLGSAVAISGAAVSANMGGNTIRALSPTLALLNIRLGYWLTNPRFVISHTKARRVLQLIWQRFTSKFYLLKEIFNLQDETSPAVYLTDGGHIENLGVYELLKRGCETIVVIDAEADPEMAFPSLLKLERFARIDLGVRIDLPWEKISSGWSTYENGRGRAERPQAPHCVVGKIRYADGVDGLLVYFKSSVTGDERDYILDYQRRNPSFPHETTGDQFFSEEQFEMYRALGYHMVDGFFSGDKPFDYLPADLGGFSDAKQAYTEVCASLVKATMAPA